MHLILMAITISQLWVACTKNLVQRDWSQMPLSERARVFDAINDALKDWFLLAAKIYTTNNDSTEIFAPTPITLNVTANSPTFTVASGIPATGYPNLASLVTKAIVISGDGQILNRVDSFSGTTGTLWRNYLGATGTAQATVYCDTVTFTQTDFEVVTPPIFTGPTNYTTGWPLLEWEQENPWMDAYVPEYSWLYYGRPIYYLTGNHIPMNGTSGPYWYMRLWPLPGYTGNVSYSIKSMPACYSDADIPTNRLVPVPDEYKGLIANLTQRDLIASPLWNKDCDRDAAFKTAQRAYNELSLRVAGHTTDAAPRPFGTPWGW